jgi:hypothetical protein
MLKESEAFVKFKTQRTARRSKNDLDRALTRLNSPSFALALKEFLAREGRNYAQDDSCLTKLSKPKPRSRKEIVP